MTKEAEKLEALFRRNLAVEPIARKTGQVMARITAAAPLGRVEPSFREGDPDLSPALWPTLAEPECRLVPSAGTFNIARVPQSADVWMIVVGAIDREKFEHFVADACNAQSAEQSFRMLFVLKDNSQIEVMRRFGLSFEVLAEPDFIGLSHEGQVERFSRKWGCSLKLAVGRVDGDKETALPGETRAAWSGAGQARQGSG